MDPESKKLLEETFRLAEENNRMLKRVRSVQKWSMFWKMAYILVIFGIAAGAFYYLTPYLEGLMSIYGSVSGAESNMTGGGGSLKDFLNNFSGY